MARPKNPSKHVEVEVDMKRDEMAVALQKALNRSRKDGSQLSYFLDEDTSPCIVKDWVSTGSTWLDLAIANREYAGMPVGKLVELSGLEGTGKSLFCATIIAETQKKGGLAVYFDTEYAVDPTFWKALGIKVEDVNYVAVTTLEDLFTSLELCIGEFRKACPDRLLTIIVDSLTQASTETEMEDAHGVKGFNTGRAITISKAMRKLVGLIAEQNILVVATNQVRFNMNAGPHGEKWITPGGKAYAFATSVRVRFANLGKLKKGDEVIGIKCQAQVFKNRLGPPCRTAQFELHFDSGIQDYKSWIDLMKNYGVATGDGQTGYTWERPSTKEKMKFKSAQFVEMMNNDPVLKKEVYESICSAYIMKYQKIGTKPVDETLVEAQEEDIAAKSVSNDD